MTRKGKAPNYLLSPPKTRFVRTDDVIRPGLHGQRRLQIARSGARAERAGLAASDETIAVEQVDIDLPDSVDALAKRLAGRRFDLLFINAGIAGPQHQSVDATTPQEIGALMYTNAVAPIRIARRLLPLLKR